MSEVEVEFDVRVSVNAVRDVDSEYERKVDLLNGSL